MKRKEIFSMNFPSNLMLIGKWEENSLMKRRCSKTYTFINIFGNFFLHMMRKNRKELSRLKKTHEKWKLKFSWEEFSASFSGWSSKEKQPVWVEPRSNENIGRRFFFWTVLILESTKKRENCHKFSSTSRRK